MGLRLTLVPAVLWPLLRGRGHSPQDGIWVSCRLLLLMFSGHLSSLSILPTPVRLMNQYLRPCSHVISPDLDSFTPSHWLCSDCSLSTHVPGIVCVVRQAQPPWAHPCVSWTELRGLH